MNRAKLTSLKYDLNQHGVHPVALMGMSKRDVVTLARKMGIRRVDKVRLMRRPAKLRAQIAQAAARKAAGSKRILTKVVNKVKEAFRR